jgi:hypothetical protein
MSKRKEPKAHQRTRDRRTVAKQKNRSKPPEATANNALLKACTQVRAILDRADKQDIQARYEAAVLCLEIRDGAGEGGRYGKKAVQILAKNLGWSKSGVHAYANVAKTWPDLGQIDELVNRFEKANKRLSWSHLVLLAGVASAKQREGLIANTVDHGWSVRELKAGICPKQITPEPGVKVSPAAVVPRALAVAAKEYISRVIALTRSADVFSEALIEQVDAVEDADIPGTVVEQLHEACDQLRKVLEKHDRLIDALERRQAQPTQSQNEWDSDDERHEDAGDVPEDEPAEALVAV